MENNGSKFNTRFIVRTGLMAAVCFAATAINLKFSFTGATGSTMIHLGSTAGFLAAMLFGGLSGGLAGGIGMGLFDLTGGYAFTAPWTLIIKFFAGYAVGKIAWKNGKKGESQSTNLIACVTGGIINLVGYTIYTFLTTWIVFFSPSGTYFNNTLKAALLAAGSQAVGSIATTILAIIIAIPFNDSIRKALKGSNLLK
ncbi:MAG TPA: ECF transporter S component [Clostridia bacterium]|nr:ECF transporter S component [Clostridia bacterium]